jgi:hypothetical protein
MAGLGIATTDDFDTAIFKQVNWTADDASLLGYVCTDPPPDLIHPNSPIARAQMYRCTVHSVESDVHTLSMCAITQSAP